MRGAQGPRTSATALRSLLEDVVANVNALPDQLGHSIADRANRINTIMLRSPYARDVASVDCSNATGIFKLREKCRAIDRNKSQRAEYIVN